MAWVTAAATGGAAITALWLADKERRLREKAGEREARFVRLVIHPEIDQFLNHLVDVSSCLHDISNGRHLEDDKVLERLTFITGRLKLETTRSERGHFGSLTSDEVDAIASLLGQLVPLHSTLEQFATHSKMFLFIVFNRGRLDEIRKAAICVREVLGEERVAGRVQAIEHSLAFDGDTWWARNWAEAMARSLGKDPENYR